MNVAASLERYYTSSDGLRLFYREYPAATPGRLPVLCLPGLTRNSRDFDHVARQLQPTRTVLCADLRGRGRSQHDPHWLNYHPGTYLADIAQLLLDAGVTRCILLGTSLGGILSMFLTATQPALVAAVILNDIGPEVAPEGLARIAGYVGKSTPPVTWSEAAATVRATYQAALPGLNDAQWLDYARRTYTDVDGVPKLDMDPRIGDAVRNAPAVAAPDLWMPYAALRAVPTLAIRGVMSDVLSQPTFDRMLRDKPDLQRVVVANRGHAPLLDEPECVAAIDAFLARQP
jgi:pimeloyl-ACP methyl ester carboxylesterase